MKFVLSPHATLPPCLNKSEAVAHELGEGGGHGDGSDAQAVVLAGGVGEDKGGIGQQRQPRGGAEPVPAVDAVIVHEDAADGGDEHEGDDADGEHHWEQVDGLQRLGIFLVEIDAGYAAVVDLAEELLQVGAALVPHPCPGEQAAAASGLEDAYAEVYVLAEAHA